MRVNKWPLFVFLCLLATTVSAQKTLEKPYNTWGKDEATKIMTDSPWAKTYQSTEAASAAAQQQVSRDQADGRMSTGGGRGSSTRSAGPLPVVIRLHSALPVRQAQVRRQQLEAGYDKM